MRDLSFWKSKANESMQCGQLKNATEIVMEHLLDELGRRNGEHDYSGVFPVNAASKETLGDGLVYNPATISMSQEPRRFPGPEF